MLKVLSSKSVPWLRLAQMQTASVPRLMSTGRESSHYIEDNLKLKITESPNETYIDVEPVNTGRENRLIEVPEATKACVLCRLNLTNLDYTDVMILGQFVKRNGSIVTFHESNLCPKQYTKILRLIKKAQRCNLMERPADYLVPGPWHNMNTYLELDRRRDQPMKVVKKEYWKL